ncbi:hypothetical protein L227DRAFT_616986 [Lentinus tigrinus ALCF2SS1-6]|uniref:Uncharacterized protein n=1 Tax=Lentinus tigrinus ALCF2SS1-6 TaxID=1328759 RepID=A0A5C2RQB3_9APHY|nr:hypothetical protein L227DRAFT_616986 [Lentinus tigrinus ALCF2SS1-6]
MSTDAPGSPTPILDDKIALRVMCWYENHIPPEVMMVENVRGEPLRLTKTHWLESLCKAEGKNTFIDLWSERHGDWTTNTLTTLVVSTERTTMTILLRLAHATFCDGLGVWRSRYWSKPEAGHWLPSTPVLFELWDVYSERWVAKKIGEAITVEESFNCVLIRHQDNFANIDIG